jgi:predicted Zn-dependent protease
MLRPPPAAARRAAAPTLALLLLAPLAARGGQGVYETLPLKPKDALLVEKSAELEELFQRRGFVVPDGPAVDLVRRVGAAVAPERPVDDYQRFRFAVVRNPVPNAFALPDGQVYVHAGLLALLENEAQLAAVLAHECMHVEGHHSIVNARQARKKQGGMVVLSVLLGDIGGLVNVALQAAIFGYSRDLEQEADVGALQRVLDAGYDPRATPRIYDLLEEDPEGERLQVSPMWADHPLGRQRAAYTAEIVAGMEEQIADREREDGPLRVGADDFTAQTAGVARESIEQLIRADRPRTALRLAARLLERQPADPATLALVGDAWRELDARSPDLPPDALTRKQVRARIEQRAELTRQEREELRRRDPAALPVLAENWERAVEAYLDALRLEPDHPAALRGLGLVLQEKGDLLAAGRRLARYLQVAPDALDRPQVLKALADITAGLKVTAPEAAP